MLFVILEISQINRIFLNAHSSSCPYIVLPFTYESISIREFEFAQTSSMIFLPISNKMISIFKNVNSYSMSFIIGPLAVIFFFSLDRGSPSIDGILGPFPNIGVILFVCIGPDSINQAVFEVALISSIFCLQGSETMSLIVFEITIVNFIQLLFNSGTVFLSLEEHSHILSIVQLS